VKVGDLGSALEADESLVPTFLLVSRYFRAPEIILGLSYSYPIDIFSYGCCLYEFATGETLLKSVDNNHHLELFMQIKGMISKKMIDKGEFRESHYDKEYHFLKHVNDKVSGKFFVKKLNIPNEPTRNILKELMDAFPDKTPEEEKLIQYLHDLISKCIESDPSRRIEPVEGLHHAFFKDN